jgi:hypothetical protein
MPTFVSANINERARFEQAVRPEAPSETHQAEYAQYQQDVEAANVGRDPAAFVRARAAEGVTVTPAQVADFKNPTLAEVLGAEHTSLVTGVEIPDDSPLADKAAELWAAKEKADVDRDPAAFIASRGHEPTTAADLAAFNTPSDAAVLTAARQSNLRGVDIPADSALAQQLSNVLGGLPGGQVTPTNTVGTGAVGSQTQPGAGMGTTSGTGTGTGTSTIDRADFGSTGLVSGDTKQTPAAGQAPAAGESPMAAGAPVAASDQTPPATSEPSAIDAALANLSNGTPTEQEIPTSRGTEPTSTDHSDLGWQGSVTPAPGKSVTVDVEAKGGFDAVGGISTDADGGVVQQQPGGSTATTYPDGTTVYRDSAGNTTGTGTGVNYEATVKASHESASADTSGSSGSTDTTSGADSTNTTDSTDSTDSTDTTDSGDSGEATAMTNPDADTAPTGLAAGLFDPLGMPTTNGSSTHGGATDSGRGDLDGGLGSVTAEVSRPLTATPRVDPDNVTAAGGRIADPYHSGAGVGAVDGVRPDLVDASGIGGGVEPPTDTGINPQAATSGDEALNASIASDHMTTATDHAALSSIPDPGSHSLDAGAQLGAGDMAHLDVNSGIVAPPDGADAGADVGFGGPLDDGLGS